MLKKTTYHILVAILAGLAYFSLFYFQKEVEYFSKLQVSKLLRVANPELWRVRFTTSIVLDVAAIILLQLIIYFTLGNKKYSLFCVAIFCLFYMVGLTVVALTLVFSQGMLAGFSNLLFNLTTEPFLALVLIAAYPVFNVDNRMYK